MKHKWHDEIVAFGNGIEIEVKHQGYEWEKADNLIYIDNDKVQYRIKPQQVPYWVCCGNADIRQECHFGTADEHSKRCGGTDTPKQPKYLYAYYRDKVYFLQDKDASNRYYIGKIEVQDD